jgi:hypothetical protein
MHQTNLAAAMMDQWSVVNPDLTIADLIRPMEGFGPHSGTPADFGCIVASRDPVALDATVCRMVGLDINQVEYFEAALNRGLGNFEEEDIEIRGNSIEEVYKPLYLPYLDGFERWPDYQFYTEHSCSTCQGLLAFTMTKLEALGEYERNQGLNILVGRKKVMPKELEGKGDMLLMGVCTWMSARRGLPLLDDCGSRESAIPEDARGSGEGEAEKRGRRGEALLVA